MTLGECRDRLDATWVVDGDPSTEFTDVVVSDLMSEVLVTDHELFIMVTSLTSEQVVRTADIVEAQAIVITNGKHPTTSLLDLARKHEMPVLTTPKRTFQACVALVGCDPSLARE